MLLASFVGWLLLLLAGTVCSDAAANVLSELYKKVWCVVFDAANGRCGSIFNGRRKVRSVWTPFSYTHKQTTE